MLCSYAFVADGDRVPGRVVALRADEATVDVKYDDGSVQAHVPISFVSKDSPPGDPGVSHNCSVCQKSNPDEDVIRCDGCEDPCWVHDRCYFNTSEDEEWFCMRCRDVISRENQSRTSGGGLPLASGEAMALCKKQSIDYGCAACPNKGKRCGMFVELPAELGAPEPWMHINCAAQFDKLWVNPDPSGQGGGTVLGWNAPGIEDMLWQAVMKCSVCKEYGGLVSGCAVTSFEQYYVPGHKGWKWNGDAPNPMPPETRFAVIDAPVELGLRNVSGGAISFTQAEAARKAATDSAALQSLLDCDCSHSMHVSCAVFKRGLYSAFVADDLTEAGSTNKRGYVLCDGHTFKLHGLLSIVRNKAPSTAPSALAATILSRYGSRAVAQPPELEHHWEKIPQLNPRMAWLLDWIHSQGMLEGDAPDAAATNEAEAGAADAGAAAQDMHIDDAPAAEAGAPVVAAAHESIEDEAAPDDGGAEAPAVASSSVVVENPAPVSSPVNEPDAVHAEPRFDELFPATSVSVEGGSANPIAVDEAPASMEQAPQAIAPLLDEEPAASHNEQEPIFATELKAGASSAREPAAISTGTTATSVAAAAETHDCSVLAEAPVALDAGQVEGDQSDPAPSRKRPRLDLPDLAACASPVPTPVDAAAAAATASASLSLAPASSDGHLESSRSAAAVPSAPATLHALPSASGTASAEPSPAVGDLCSAKALVATLGAIVAAAVRRPEWASDDILSKHLLKMVSDSLARLIKEQGPHPARPLQQAVDAIGATLVALPRELADLVVGGQLQLSVVWATWTGYRWDADGAGHWQAMLRRTY